MENLKQRLSELKLKSEDDLDALNSILEEIKAADYPKDFILPLLHVLECNPNFDFGTPGYLVSTIEKISVKFTSEEYFDVLIQSVERVPMEYNLWLMNRMMNTFEDKSQIKKGLTVFQKVTQETANIGLCGLVQRFIERFDK